MRTRRHKANIRKRRTRRKRGRTRNRRRKRGRPTRRRRRGGANPLGAIKSLLGRGSKGNTGKRGSKQLPITVMCDSVDAMADAACEVVGLGPEDPIADVCAYEMATHIAKWCKQFVYKHEPSILKKILSNPLSILKNLTRRKKRGSVLSPLAAKSDIGVEI